MKPYAMAFCLFSALSLGGCVAPGYMDDGYYYTGASYNPDCDYYTPPWGYPADYCRYRVWNQPVYFSGVWYDGPIYYRNLRGVNWFWLNGNWRRDEWRGGPRPNVDYNRGGNQFWRGAIHRARDAMQMPMRGGADRGPRPGPNDQRRPDDRGGRGERGPGPD
jgi:hypothetical protein